MTTANFLNNHLDHVRKSGDGWTAQCPAHDDRTNSLSVSERSTKILVHCHAGCSTASVVKSLGLLLSDLYLDSHQGKGTAPKVVPTYDHTDESIVKL